MRTVLVLLLLLTVCPSARTQVPTNLIFSARNYDVNDGLLHRRVTQTIQDRDGFIWLATPAGVQRFDGFTFTDRTTKNGLTTNAVSMIWPDADGMLWLVSRSHYSEGHVSSVDILDPRSGSVSTFAAYFGSEAPCKAEELVDKALVLNDGTLLLSTKGELIHYHSRSKGITTLQVSTDDVLRPFARTPDGTVWCLRLQPRKDHMDLVKVDPTGSVALVPGGPYRLGAMGRIEGCDLREGDAGLYYIGEPLGDAVHEYLLSPDGGIRQFPDSLDGTSFFRWNGTLYLELGAGNWLVDATVRHVPVGGAPRNAPVLFDLGRSHPVISAGLHHTMRDRTGHIWMSTEFGLWQLDVRQGHFQRWLQRSDPLDEPLRSFRGLAVKGDTLFAASEQDGLYAVDVGTGSTRRLDDGSWQLRYLLAPDQHGGLWSGRSKSVLHRKNGQQVDGQLKIDRMPLCVLPLEGGRLLLGTTFGLAWTDTSLTTYEPLEPAVQGRIAGSTIGQLFRDRSGALWVCSSRGLGELNADGTVHRVWWRGDSAHFLPAEDFRHIHEDSEGIFWVSTATSGLLRWDRKEGEVRAITRSDGMPSNGIYAVYQDERGMLWMPTDNGIACYHPGTERIRSYSTLDGITHNEFNRWSHAQGTDGRLYFGGLNGITAFHPDSLNRAPTVELAPLVIAKLQQFDGSEGRLVDRTASVIGTGAISVHPLDRFFTLNMALLGYEEPGAVLFAWRVDGVDVDWNHQREPVLRFASLPYGSNTLRIRAKGGSGVWTPERTIMIHVLRPWYWRWWAIVIYVLVISGGVFALFRYRLSKVKAMISMRDRIALDLHDEVGSTLSSVALFTTVMGSNTRERPAEETAMLKRIAKNSAQAMEGMNDIVWSVNTRYEKLSDVEDRMLSYAGPLSEAKGWELEIDVEEAIRGTRLNMNERKNLYLIFKEAVNNAAKYAQCDRVEVHLRRSNGLVELSVMDNGVGIAPAALGNGILGGNGLRSMQQRALDIKGEFRIKAREGGGTIITVRFRPHAE